jgi:hypothetical protein
MNDSLDGSHSRIYHRILMAHEGQPKTHSVFPARSLSVRDCPNVNEQPLMCQKVWINVLYTVSTSIVNVVQCTPIRYAWAKPALDTLDASGLIIPGGKCIASRTFILSSCALSIFMDIIISTTTQSFAPRPLLPPN